MNSSGGWLTGGTAADGVKYITNLAFCLSRRVEADPGQIEQVILNLAPNARDAMPDGGALTIQTSNVCFDSGDLSHPLTLQPGPYVLFSVIDTGHRMDAATRERIFELFFDGHRTKGSPNPG